MRHWMIYCLFFLPCFSQGQITVYNSSLRDTTKNELYWGLDNIICIKGIDDSKNDVVIKMANGKVEKVSKGYYNVSLNFGTDYVKRDTLNIFKKGSLVFSKAFDLHTVPNFYLQFGNKRDSAMSVRDILMSPNIKAIIPKFNYKNYSYRPIVFAFSIKIQASQSESPYERDVFGNALLKEDISEIRKLNSGDKIIIDKIRIYNPCPVDPEVVLSITIE